MEIVVTRQDIKEINDFIERGPLVQLMNDKGMSFGAMALILTAISNECDRILEEMNREEENVC